VSSGTACAIRSSGFGSVVTVNGGVVTNAATNNANPAIYMNVGSGGAAGSPATPANTNVIITGGRVESSSPAGYAIQTAGSIFVSGGTVTAGGTSGGIGRAINLVGIYSNATISGGTVTTTGTGTAVSTATSADVNVQYSSVAVSGGTVSSAGGNAINITGADSTATVSGGSVVANGTGTAAACSAINASGAGNIVLIAGGLVQTTGAGHAVNASGANAAVTVSGGAAQATGSGSALNVTGASAGIAVEGGLVQTTDAGSAINLGTATSVTVTGGLVQTTGAGNAINANAAGATNSILVDGGAVRADGNGANAIYSTRTGVAITVQNTANAPSASQVSATTGYAISSPGSIAIMGGFVFAYGQDDSDVISNSSYLFNDPSGNGLVVAWQDPTLLTYVRGSSNKLATLPAVSPDPATWAMGGIQYAYGTGTGFFPLGVTVTADNGLIFNVIDGKFYFNLDGSGNPYSATNSSNEYTPPPGTTAWDGTNNILTLNNFSWNADLLEGEDTTQVALVLYGDGTQLTIDLASGSTNTFISSSRGHTVTQNGLAGIYAFQNVGTLIITGSGTLRAVGGEMDSTFTNGMSHGIITESSIVIEGGTVEAQGGQTAYASTGIYVFPACNLTIDGGTLSANGGTVTTTTANGVSAGVWLQATSTLVVNGGTTTAVGGSTTASTIARSIGIINGSAADNARINGGAVTAIGGVATAGSGGTATSAGMYGIGSFYGGTLTAKGGTAAGGASQINALYSAPSVQAPAYTWWAWPSKGTDPSGAGITYAADAPSPFDSPYPYLASDTFVQLTSGSFATIAPVTVSGVVGSALPQPQTATITVYGEALAFSGVDASSWFANLPSGVSVTADAVTVGSNTEITLSFGGTPWVPSGEAFDITLPGSLFASGADVKVSANADAKFAIENVFDLFIEVGTGGTVNPASTASGKYTAGTGISVTAVPDPGFVFVGWTAVGTGASRVAALGFSMPSNRVILTANFAPASAPPNPLNPGGSGSAGGSAGMGDASHTAVLVALAASALATLGLLAWRRKRRAR
ncbi:MAG: hypothetical protein FWD72_00520, partial [Eggerthellaceae bacterium]|nr:hypothetical protein [Eggerthellaceae bacterium]